MTRIRASLTRRILRRGRPLRAALGITTIATLVGLCAAAAAPAAADQSSLRFVAMVDRIDGPDRYAVAVAISQAAYPAGTRFLVVTSGANYPDALSAAPLASKRNAPVLLTPPDQLPQNVAAEIHRLNPAVIILIGGPNSVSPDVQSQIVLAAAAGTAISRIGGADRYEMSRNVAATMFPGNSRAYVATGTDFPDALSAGSPAGNTELPIILVDGASPTLDRATSTLITDTMLIHRITIIGGPNSVSTGIQSDIAALPIVDSLIRREGSDRYETSVSTNLGVYTHSDRAFLATGLNFPDALAGSAWAGNLGAPLFVVPGDCVPQMTLDAMQTLGVTHVTLLGGINSLGSGVASLTPCS
jgi:putative cell wall-binding protein